MYPEKKIWTQELLKVMYPVDNKNLVSALTKNLYNFPQCGRQYFNKELHMCVLQVLKTRKNIDFFSLNSVAFETPVGKAKKMLQMK